MSEVSGKVAHDSANDSHIYPVKVGGVYRATPPSVTDGDVVDLLTDEAGRLQIDITSGAIASAGDVAHDAVDSGNPVKVGARAAAVTGFSAVSVNDRTDLAATTAGILLTAAQGVAAQGATAAGNPVRIGGVYQSSPSTLSDGQIGTPLLNSSGQLNVAVSSAACGGNAAHDAVISGAPVRIAGRARSSLYSAVSDDDVADLATTQVGQLRTIRDLHASQSSGWSNFSNTALTNTPVAIKGSNGRLGPCQLFNPAASVTYFQFFDVAAGSVTLGTTPPTRVVGVPAGGALTFDFDQTAFAAASSVAATTTPTGSTAPGTAAVIGLSYV